LLSREYFTSQFFYTVHIHGAGAQRSDPKSGDPDDWPTGNGPQGDAIRINNYVRLVRSDDITETPDGYPTSARRVTITPSGSTTGTTDTDTSDQQDGPPEGGEAPNLAAAAEALDITEEELMDALGSPPPDLEITAGQLGISVEELENALFNQ